MGAGLGDVGLEIDELSEFDNNPVNSWKVSQVLEDPVVDLPMLTELLRDAHPSQFVALFEEFAAHGDAGLSLLDQEIANKAHAQWERFTAKPTRLLKVRAEFPMTRKMIGAVCRTCYTLVMEKQPQSYVPESWLRYRSWLRMLAGVGMDPQLQRVLDPSDIVQQTLVQAVQGLDEFQGTSEKALLGWLRQILVRTLSRASRDHRREKRDIRRQHSIEQAMQSSIVRVASILEADKQSPLQDLLESEQVLQLCQSMERLTESQRQALEMHYWQGMTISAIAAEMDRTPAAVGGLLKRGLKTLREILRQKTGSPRSHRISGEESP